VARQLQSLGFEAAALLGGFTAWRAAYPVERPGISDQGSGVGGQGVRMSERSG
jgi:hypothetical protein